jgi:hypothetical protein
MIRTAKKTSWDINCNHFNIDKGDDGLKFKALIRLDSGLPYLYFPKIVYDQFTAFIEAKYSTGICFPDVNICKF